MSISKDAVSALDVFSRARDALKDAKSSSLIEYTRAARVEPIVLMDDSLRHQPYMTDILQSLTSIFSGYYLQAITLSCNVGNIDTLRLLDKMNPNRDMSDSAMNGATRVANYLGTESYAGGLPGIGTEAARDTLSRFQKLGSFSKEQMAAIKDAGDAAEKARQEGFGDDDIAMIYDNVLTTHAKRSDARATERTIKAFKDSVKSAYKKETGKELDDGIDKKYYDYRPSANVNVAKSLDKLQTNVNLSVGKMLEVEIESNGSKAIVPVNVRLIVKPVVSGNMPALLTSATQDTSVKARYHKWRSGELRFVQDLLLCQDIIDNHKKALMADRDGSLRSVTGRAVKNRFSALLSGDISVANASSIIIMSQDTAKQVERELSGRLSNFRTREQLFKSTHTMLMVVVDTDWEQVIIYHRSIRDESEISIKEFKNQSKDGGPNISEILSAYKLGAAPAL